MRPLRSLALIATVGCAGTTGSAASATPPPRWERIALSRTCPAKCAKYRVLLSRNGVAAYHGDADVPMLGDYGAAIDTSTFDSLASVLAENHVLTMDTLVTVNSYDVPEVRLCITTSEFGRCIRAYGDLPYSLGKAASAIDATTKRLKWDAASPPPN